MVNDIFGIKQIYPTAEGGNEWWLDDSPEMDGQIVAQEDETIEKNSAGYFQVTNTDDVTLAVTTPTGRPSGPDCSIDYGDLSGQGYRYTSSDWRNVEMTIFFYAQDVVIDSNNTAFFMSVREASGDGSGDCCDSFRYGAWLYFADSGSDEGKVRLSKRIAADLGGERGDAGDRLAQSPTVVLPNFYRRWVGAKFICYNVVGSNNQTQVKLELWLCPSDSATDMANSWTKVCERTDSGTNWNQGGSSCGGTNSQAITWGSYMCGIDYRGDDVRWKNWSIREIDYQGTFGGGGGSGGGGDPPTGNCGSIDNLGIKWLMASGAQSVIPQSRDTDIDDRWSEVFDNAIIGYEATVIATFDGVGSDGHIALKHWGGNHCGDCQYEEDGACCCWYDTGIRANGDVQTQIERPHPSNDDWACPECTMSNIGVTMNGNTIGLKWIIYPLIYPGGNVDNGGIRLQMWVDINALNGEGRPNNNWVKVYDITDNATRGILTDYDAPTQQEIEMRNSDTDSQVMYGGGLHVRFLRRPEDLVPCVPGGGGGGNEDPVCPTGYHWDATRQICVADSGGGGNPDPPTPETLYNDFKLIYNILSDSDGCICNAPPFTPPPDVPPEDCLPGFHWDTSRLECVDDSVPPPPPPSGNALYNFGYQGGTEIKIGKDSGNSSRYLQYGIWIRGSGAAVCNKVIKRGEIALKKVGQPEGLAYVVIRNYDTNNIETTLGTINADEVGSEPQFYAAENMAATYTTQDGDRLMIEFDGGDNDNYLVGYYQDGVDGNLTKITKRSNTRSEGDYDDHNKEFASRWYA